MLRSPQRSTAAWIACGSTFLFLPFALAVTAASRAGEVFTPKHVAKVRTVVSATVSPDGTRVAYLLAVPRELMKEDSGPAWVELHVVGPVGGSRPYVTGKVNASGVAWTPDGKSISFLSKRGNDKHASLWVIPVDGGEARKVLEHETGISSYSWSPDGKRVAFLATTPQPEKEKELEKKGFNQIVYEENLEPVRLWIAEVRIDAAGGGQVDSKPRALELEGSASSLSWSPVGTSLLVALAPTPLIDDWYMKRRLRVVDADTGKITARIENPGKLGDTAWSPDGRQIAFITGEDANDPREGRLWVVPASGGAHADLLPSYEGHVAAIAWRDAARVLYIGNEGVHAVVGEAHLDVSNRKTLLPAGERIWTSISVPAGGKGLIALVGESARHPGEVFTWPSEAGGEAAVQRATDSNPWLEEMRFAKQEVIRHKARDGELWLEGVLIRPLDEESGRRYPLILTVHGGPESHIPNGWLTGYAYPGQVAAARGFAVFHPNYRGSTGRGVAFSKLGQADAAGKEFDDLVDAVDHLIGMGLVDRDRVGITGGSYGGYASAWAATRYSDRFAASVMFVGISDNVSKVGTTDIPNEMYLVHHRKWLWDDWEYFRTRSPIYHIQNARTPILILHGKDDPRVHPSQSLQLYRHLKTLGKTPVRLVLYPGEGHGNRKSAARYDYNLRMLRWMEHYLKGPRGEPPPHEVDYGLEKPKERIASLEPAGSPLRRARGTGSPARS